MMMMIISGRIMAHRSYWRRVLRVDQSSVLAARAPQIERAEILFMARAFALITSHRSTQHGPRRENEKLMEKVLRLPDTVGRPMNIYS